MYSFTETKSSYIIHSAKSSQIYKSSLDLLLTIFAPVAKRKNVMWNPLLYLKSTNICKYFKNSHSESVFGSTLRHAKTFFAVHSEYLQKFCFVSNDLSSSYLFRKFVCLFQEHINIYSFCVNSYFANCNITLNIFNA